MSALHVPFGESYGRTFCGTGGKPAAGMRSGSESSDDEASTVPGQLAGLAMICHELRNPATVMAGLIEMLAETAVERKQRDCLALMKASSESLLRLVNDTLDLARIENSGLAMENIGFSLHQSINDTMRMLLPESRRKELRMVCNIAADVPDIVQGDPFRLRQVMLNLIGNAIKFTDHGEVAVNVEWVSASQETVTCRFAIADTGPGIPEARQSAIFEPFVQAEAATALRYGGSGLGLYVSTRLVAAMHGEIGVDSHPGHGSTFFFTARFGMPARPERHSAAADRPRPRGSDTPGMQASDRTVLLVDDDLLNRCLAELVLTRAGWEVLTAGCAREALSMLDRMRPDMIVVDVHMPGVDGVALTRSIRERDVGCGIRIPIVGLTADGHPQSRQACLDAGMDECMEKPVDPVRLHHLFDRLSPPVLDAAALENRLGNSKALLREIVALFHEHSGPLISQVRTAVEAGDATASVEPLHRLAGIYRNLAAPAAAEVVAALQAPAAGRDATAARFLISRLEQENRRLGNALVSQDVLSTTRPLPHVPPRQPPSPCRLPALASGGPRKPR